MSEQDFDTVRAIRWSDEGVQLLDQRRLPEQEIWLTLTDTGSVTDAIRDMVVRGAPAIGITAAYGVVLAARNAYARAPAEWREIMQPELDGLVAARPTAVNLVWAVTRMRTLAMDLEGDPEPLLLDEARRIHEQDVAANRRMGEFGAALIEKPCDLLTHCNAGSLATGGYGTALGVVRSAFAAGRARRVYADETRPWLQGARLTAWELLKDGIPVSLIADGAAAYLLRQGGVKWVVVGSDRIAANGDVANKIGTYGLAVNARRHGAHFMVVAPTSTVDMQVATGAEIPIEERSPGEILSVSGHPVAAPGADAWNPAFDVTPAELVDVIVTEKGVVRAPNREKMEAMMEG